MGHSREWPCQQRGLCAMDVRLKACCRGTLFIHCWSRRMRVKMFRSKPGWRSFGTYGHHAHISSQKSDNKILVKRETAWVFVDIKTKRHFRLLTGFHRFLVSIQ